MTPTRDPFPIQFPRDIAIFDPARHVNGETPSWIEHIPFAFWIVGAIEPGLIVELGTHYGNSYFAMAQVVQDRGWSTAMFAVDSWEGDEHAGHYGEEVFASVSEYNAKNYGGFSTLLRTTFDEALEHFRDGEIDLLHIDGYHTYEAVKHDFESWLPKMSASGVVLLHDVAVRERGFGVNRLWAELGERYPTFCFDHGHGLGAIGTGPKVRTEVAALLELDGETPEYAAVQRLFAGLGRRFALESTQSSAIASQRAEAAAALDAALESARAEKETEIAELRAEQESLLFELRAKSDREIAATQIEADLAYAQAASAFDARLAAIIEAPN